jgi:Zn-dependent protease with chaperone function
MTGVAADWLLAYWLHGVVLGAGALLVARLGVRRPATRALLWRTALFAPLVTATLALLSSREGGTRTLSVTSPVRPWIAPEWGRRDVRVIVEQRSGEAPVRAVTVHDPLAGAMAAGVCVVAALAAAAGALGLARRQRAARRALARRTPVAWEGDVALSTAPDIASPVALRGGEICIPMPRFFALNGDEQRGVLLHELAHLERRDPAWLDAARVVTALAWWQPLNRVMLAALRRDTELAADDRAFVRGARPTALVSALAHFAAALEPTAGAALADGDSPLVARARRILADVDRAPRTAPALMLFVVTVPLLAALIALPRPSTAAVVPPLPPKMDDAHGMVARRQEMRIVRTLGPEPHWLVVGR